MSVVGKSQADSQINTDLMEKEKEKWEREQRHIESQMIGIIENNRRYEGIIRKDQEIKFKLEEQQKKMDKLMKKKIKNFDEKRKETYQKAKKPERVQRGQQVRKFREEMREAKEQYLDVNANKSAEMKKRNHGQEEGSDDDIYRPAYIFAKEKVQLHEFNVEKQLMLDYQDVGRKLEQQERKRDKCNKNLDNIRHKQQNKLGNALSLIEENRTKAESQYDKKLNEIATGFIKKLIKIESYRDQKGVKIKKDADKKRKEFKEKVEQMGEMKKSQGRDKRDKLVRQRERYNQKLQSLEAHLEHKAQEINERAELNQERIDKAREKYFNIQQALSIKSEAICDKLRTEKSKIVVRKKAEDTKIMNKIKFVHELAMKKEQLKNSFALFQTSVGGQKKSMQMMEEFGIKSDKLTRLFKEIDDTEKQKNKKTKTTGEEEEEEK